MTDTGITFPHGTLSDAAQLAADAPPRSFASFAVRPLKPPPGQDILPIVYFAVRCASCDNDAFHIGSYPMAAAGPSVGSDVPPEEAPPCPPHRLRCAGCGGVGSIFDPATDGYDGILCGGRSYQKGEREVFTGGAFNLHVTAVYNIGLPELQDLAAQAGGGVKPSDLFDWFNIFGTPVGDDEFFQADYECA